MTMRTVRVHDVLADPVLVSRESARLLEKTLRTVINDETESNTLSALPLTIDFEGIEGIAPSFLDELLSVFESLLSSESSGRDRCLIVANPPTRLSSKFEAIARGHGMTVRVRPDGSWLLTDTRKPCA